MATVTLRPTSGTGTSWSNIAYAYDGDTSTGATISATSSNYSNRIGTFNFDVSVIPSGATINSATLSISYKQSSSTTSRAYTPYVDINGDSSNRVISSQLSGTSTTTNTADVKDMLTQINTITITPYRTSTTTNTLTVYELWIDVDYTEAIPYTVTFKDWDGSVIDTQEVLSGGNATPPNNPSRTGYDFIGWQGSYTNITQDTEIIAQYKIKTFTVRFLDWDNSVIDTQTIDYGDDATPPNDPTREGYTFKEWNGTYTNITSNVDIIAQYEIKTFTVQFLDWNNNLLQSETVNYGDDATPPNDPTREGYIFIGWNGSYTNIIDNTTLIAQYKLKTMTSYIENNKLVISYSGGLKVVKVSPNNT